MKNMCVWEKLFAIIISLLELFGAVTAVWGGAKIHNESEQMLRPSKNKTKTWLEIVYYTIRV